MVGWCLSVHGALREDEPTKKVPEYLLAVARSFGDELELTTDSHTLPLSGVGTSTLDAFAEVDALELVDAFASIDKLDSAPPAPQSEVPSRPSGVVPAGTSLALVTRPVMPPPPRRPLSFAFDATLDAFTPAHAPFRAQAANEQVLVESAPRAVPLRTTVSRSVASGALAVFALFVLILVAQGPVLVVKPVARTAITLAARASSRAARAAVTRPYAGRPFPSATTRVASAQGAPGRIVRTSPY